jgi:ABC-2 type transport system permease protein
VTQQLQLAAAFFVRDARTATSYKVGFLLSTGGSIATALMLFFLSRVFEGSVAPLLTPYGGSYFGFVILGVGFSGFMAAGIAGLASKIREGQMMGTLELTMLSPTRLPLLLIYSSLWTHASAALTVGVYLTMGMAFGVDLHGANVPVAVVGLALAIVSFNALGLLAAAVVILIKQGNPVNWLVGSASVLLSGVLYPVSVLPDGLRAAGQVLPLTHALEVLRASMLRGAGFAEVLPSLTALAALTVVLVPLGLLACHGAIRIAQTDGTLANY